MRILHTSDLHIGHTLSGRARPEDFQALLGWLVDTVRTHQVDVLLIAGDVFDTTTASNQAQTLYYRFLADIIAHTPCRHTVVCGGNHDSPAFLNAPRDVLRGMNVHVVAQTTGNVDDEILVLKDQNGRAELIVCGVPYLRDRDVRTSVAAETQDEKILRRQTGIRDHYARVVQAAQAVQKSCLPPVPLVAMGHLFVTGSSVGDDDGVRDVSIGSLGQVPADIFPETLDYVALGHLHRPQCVGGRDTVRYSGAPLPLGFGDAGVSKSVVLVTLGPPGGRADITLIPVPVFRRLERIQGDLDQITAHLHHLAAAGDPVWGEVLHTGPAPIPHLSDKLNALVQGTPVEILKTKNTALATAPLRHRTDGTRLADMGEDEVFESLLADRNIPPDDRIGLRTTWKEALHILNEETS